MIAERKQPRITLSGWGAGRNRDVTLTPSRGCRPNAPNDLRRTFQSRVRPRAPRSDDRQTTESASADGAAHGGVAQYPGLAARFTPHSDPTMATKPKVAAKNCQPTRPLPTAPSLSAPASVASSRRTSILAATVIVFAAFVAFNNSFRGPFIADDLWSITNNRTILRLSSALAPPSDTTTGGRPLLNLTFAVNYALGGMNVWGYHVLNLLIHILASLTLFGIVRRTLLKPAISRRFGAAALPLALAVSVVWSVHPLQTEAVTFVSQRAEALMGFFYLLTLYSFIRSTESDRRRGWQMLSVTACFLGVFSKEIIITAPVIVFLYDRTFVAGSFRNAWRLRWRYYLVLASSWLLLARLMADIGQRAVGFGHGVTWWNYALTSSRSIVVYLKLAVWPHPLVFDYGTDAIVVHNPSDVIQYIVVIVTLLAFVAVALRRFPPIGFLGAWFFVILAPTTSVVPVVLQPTAEHRMYFPLAALISFGVLGLYSLIEKRSSIVLAAVASGFCYLSVCRNSDYRSGLAIWTDTATKAPNNERAENNLGAALVDTPGRLTEAIARYRRALTINPDYALAHNNLGRALLYTHGGAAKAIAEFRMALRLNPNFALAHCNLGTALINSPGMTEEAIGHLRKGVELEPDLAQAHYELANALADQPGRLAEAIAEYNTAIRLNPDFSEAHSGLGLVLLRISGRTNDAIEQDREALRIQPNSPIYHNNLAIALAQQPGRFSDALAEYKNAIELDPRFAEAHCNLGLALLKIPDRKDEAIGQLRRALDIDPKLAVAHNNIGLALSTVPGRQDDAIAEYQSALHIDPNYADARNNFGNLLARIPGRLYDAIDQYEAALHVEPDFAEAHYDLGVALLQIPGRTEEGRRHIEEALRIRPNFELARRLIGRLSSTQDR